MKEPNPDWVEGLRDQCKWTKVPFFYNEAPYITPGMTNFTTPY